MKDKKDVKDLASTFSGTLVSLLLNALMLQIAWEAIAEVAGLPVFTYWVYFALMWVLEAVCGYVSRGGTS